MKSETKEGWLKRNLFSIFSFLLIVSISVAIFYCYRTYPKRLEELKNYGYLGAFLISLLLNATVILPAGNVLVLAALGASLPYPFLVGLTAGVGGAIGELSGYMAGYSGRKIFERTRLYCCVEGWVKKWGMLTIFLFSIAPIFFDVAGLAAGVTRFPIRKFFIACWLGRTIFYIAVAFAGHYGWEALLRFLS